MKESKIHDVENGKSDVKEEPGSVARERVKQIFQYLSALQHRKYPTIRRITDQKWSKRFGEFPNHPAIAFGDFAADNQELDDDVPEQESDEDFVVRVGRPNLTTCPAPPEELDAWLEPGWEDPAKEATVIDTINERGDEGTTVATDFDDDPSRLSSFDQWKVDRARWAEAELPARKAMELFESLFALHGWIDRESEAVQLMIGDGMLRWRMSEGDILHPLLLQRVSLRFDATTPQFSIVEEVATPEIYTPLLSGLANVDSGLISKLQEELEQGAYHPLAGAGVDAFLKSIVTRLSPRGEFVPGVPKATDDNNPTIGRDPVLFLRSRMLGFGLAIDRVIDDLEGDREIPASLIQICGGDARPGGEGPSEWTVTPQPWNEPEDVLLSKPANREQIAIAQRINDHDAVIVQGPPGTGKSHTIANLIGHLLAHNKTVLVTSHTAKALKVLRGHVVDALRPLCVSVLGREQDARHQLREAVEAIVHGLSTFDQRTLIHKAHELAGERVRLRTKLKETVDKLRLLRELEWRPVEFAGSESCTPREAAETLAENPEHGWLPGPVAKCVVLPLSDEEVQELYETSESFSEVDQKEIGEANPPLRLLLTPSEIAEVIDAEAVAMTEDRSCGAELWTEPEGAEAEEYGPAGLEELYQNITVAVEPFSGEEDWQITVIHDGQNGEDARLPWINLVRETREAAEAARAVRELEIRYQPRLSPDVEEMDARAVLDQIIARVTKKGKIGLLTRLLHPKWRSLIGESSVNGKPPSRLEHFHALGKQLTAMVRLRELTLRWDRQVAPLGIKTTVGLGHEFLETAEQYTGKIEAFLDWEVRCWGPLEAKLRTFGFQWDVFFASQPVVEGHFAHLRRLYAAIDGDLDAIIASRRRTLVISGANETLAACLEELSEYQGSLSQRLSDAVRKRDNAAYEEAHTRLKELEAKHDLQVRREALLHRLEPLAPTWADAIRLRTGVHGKPTIPGNPEAAWVWRQLADEFDRRDELDEDALIAESSRLQDELHRVTAELIEAKAWIGQIQRTGTAERQALGGWSETMKRIGRGTGRRAPRLRIEARRLMSKARSAVPVWIMPLSQVVDNFDPREHRFDVVIIDEASQNDVTGLIAFYMGAKVIVVGDQEQVSPSAVGESIDVVEDLIATYLDGVPLAHLYDGKMSVYELGRESFGGTLSLREHFRCVPDIIAFSNHLAYGGQIKALRDASSTDLRPSVVEYRVTGAYSQKKMNPMEARAVVALITACTEQPEYDGETFGVISLVGSEQAREIERQLAERIGLGEFEARKLTSGSSAEFQGDERDVMFLSVVDAPADGLLRMRNDDTFRQRYNVAASRARNQMWVVHSLDPRNDLKPGDLRRRLIEHARDPSELARAVEHTQKRAESPFEKAVIEKLVTRGYTVRSQVSVGYYRIDIVAYGENKKSMAIECDGEEFHPPEKIPEDMERQATLERCGWSFIRIRGSHFYRDPEGTMERVFQKLDAFGIEAVRESSAELGDSKHEELRERVVRRAEELMRQWEVEDPVPPPALDPVYEHEPASKHLSNPIA